jgi:hypothetical protein
MTMIAKITEIVHRLPQIQVGAAMLLAGFSNDEIADTVLHSMIKSILPATTPALESTPPPPFKSKNPSWRSDIANESVQYHHHHDGDSCHGRVYQVTIVDSGSVNMNESVQYHRPHDGDSCHGCVDQVTIVDSGVDLGSVNANESVQYHHHHDGDSCHGRVDQVTID